MERETIAGDRKGTHGSKKSVQFFPDIVPREERICPFQIMCFPSGCVANALDVPKWTNSRGVIIRTDAHNSSVLEFESTWERTDSKTGSLSEKCIVWQLFCVLHPFEEQNCVLILVFLPCLYPSLWRLLCPSKAQNTTVSVRVCCVAPSSFSNAG